MKYVILVILISLSAPASAYQTDLRLSESENNKIEGADVRLSKDGRIVGKVDPFHTASITDMVVRESENCDFRKVSNTEVRLGSRCEFLSGVFTYVFSGQGGTRQQMVLAFTASRTGGSEVFMTSAPVVVLAQ